MERVKRADEWFEKRLDMTEDEKKQERRAMDAFLKTLGNSYSLPSHSASRWSALLEPLDDEILDEINFWIGSYVSTFLPAFLLELDKLFMDRAFLVWWSILRLFIHEWSQLWVTPYLSDGKERCWEQSQLADLHEPQCWTRCDTILVMDVGNFLQFCTYLSIGFITKQKLESIDRASCPIWNREARTRTGTSLASLRGTEFSFSEIVGGFSFMCFMCFRRFPAWTRFVAVGICSVVDPTGTVREFSTLESTISLRKAWVRIHFRIPPSVRHFNAISTSTS